MTTSETTNADFTHAVNEAAAKHDLTPEKCLHIMAFDFERVILDRPKLKRLQERYAAGLREMAGSVVNGPVGGVIKEVW